MGRLHVIQSSNKTSKTHTYCLSVYLENFVANKVRQTLALPATFTPCPCPFHSLFMALPVDEVASSWPSLLYKIMKSIVFLCSTRSNNPWPLLATRFYRETLSICFSSVSRVTERGERQNKRLPGAKQQWVKWIWSHRQLPSCSHLLQFPMNQKRKEDTIVYPTKTTRGLHLARTSANNEDMREFSWYL